MPDPLVVAFVPGVTPGKWERIWRERRPVGRVSVGIGGRLRRALFARLLKAELGRTPTGVA